VETHTVATRFAYIRLKKAVVPDLLEIFLGAKKMLSRMDPRAASTPHLRSVLHAAEVERRKAAPALAAVLPVPHDVRIQQSRLRRGTNQLPVALRGWSRN